MTPKSSSKAYAAGFHNGGRIAFGPERTLYVTTGDAGSRRSSQDSADLNGKILRMTPDGEPVPGSPVRDSVVYSPGHRNVQGLAWHRTGRLYATEFGQNTFNEVNIIASGGNYAGPSSKARARRR